jgi:hypothetical protein
MKQTKIILSGPAGSAVVLFRYKATLFYGETEVYGDPLIVDNVEIQLSLPQPILLPFSAGYPKEKSYYHCYAAAMSAANELGLRFQVEDPPVANIFNPAEIAHQAVKRGAERISDDELESYIIKRIEPSYAGRASDFLPPRAARQSGWNKD